MRCPLRHQPSFKKGCPSERVVRLNEPCRQNVGELNTRGMEDIPAREVSVDKKPEVRSCDSVSLDFRVPAFW